MPHDATDDTAPRPSRPDAIRMRPPGAPPQPPTQTTTGFLDNPQDPPELPGYTIEQCLERTTTHGVYRALHLTTDKRVIVKILHERSQVIRGDIERFFHEARILSQLDHPGIVKIHEIGMVEQRPYYSTEYFPGENLQGRLTYGTWTPEATALLVEKIADALHHVHSQGFVHGNIKPANIYFDEHDEPRIIDFGLARLREKPVDLPGTVTGTPRYMAPEAVRGQDAIGPPADIWALGVILCECTTGQAPFAQTSMIEMLRELASPGPGPAWEGNPALPADFEAICRKCLQKQVKDRYAAVDGLARDLRRFQTGEAISIRPARLWQKYWKRVRSLGL